MNATIAKFASLLFAALLALPLFGGQNSDVSGNTVKITSIGQRTGEDCARDRAMLFEDPTGVRILYDPGVTRTARFIALVPEVRVYVPLSGRTMQLDGSA